MQEIEHAAHESCTFSQMIWVQNGMPQLSAMSKTHQWAMRLAVLITDLDITILTHQQQAPASRARTDRPAGTQCCSQATGWPHPRLRAALAASPGLAGWGRRRA